MTRLSSVKAINIIILTIISFLRPSFPDLQSRFRHGTERRTANGHQSPYGAGITNITYFSLVLSSRFQFTFFQFIGFAFSCHSLSHSSLTDLIHISTSVSLLMSSRVSLTFFSFIVLCSSSRLSQLLCCV